VRGSIGPRVAARLDGMVPLAHAPTWFARAGNALPLAWAALLLALSLVALRRARR
jgi:apolipoprotein N-acyltransferase